MKRILFFLLVVLTVQLVNAQSVGIGTTSPNASAQLDVTSTTKGMLIPRMTGAQRTAIASPVPGLLVIQTNSEVMPPSSPGLYLFELSGLPPGDWKRIARADEITVGTSTWTVNGSNQYSNVAGNVGIGTSAPSPSALLDVTSISKGVLVPRMTTAQRTAIVSPASGLFVYDNTSNGFWYYNGSAWVQISNVSGSDWLNNANDIYNANTGNVGIGTSSPSASALLDVSSTSKGILVPRMTTAQRNTIVSPAPGLLVYDNSLKDFYHFDGGSWREINLWNSSSTRNYVYNLTDSIGIGTNTPATKFHLVGDGTLESGDLGINNSTGGIKWKDANLTKARAQMFGGNFDLNIGTVAGNTTGKLFLETQGLNRLTIDPAGNVGIGTIAPNFKLDVRGDIYTDGNINIDNTSAILQLKSSNVNKGFYQLSGDNVRFGTNSGNTLGDVILRMDGDDMINFHKNSSGGASMQMNTNGVSAAVLQTSSLGNVLLSTLTPNAQVQLGGEVFINNTANSTGIGTASPLSKLHILNGGDVSLTSNGYLMLGPVTGTNLIFDNNEIMARDAGAIASLILQNDGGTVRIGNVAVPSGYKFAINGKMICEELKVKLASSGWPDYVFDKKYKLPTLQEVEKFIQQNKHLPNIPSATEVEKNGIEVGEMQKRMMEKIEELTLYVIELQKQVDELKKK